MKKRGYAVLVGLAANLVLASASYGKSTLLSLTVEPIWPTNSAPGNVMSYKVTAVREGSGLLNVSLSSLGLPSGATVAFSPGVLRFTGHVPTSQTAIMTVTCVNPTAVDNYPFTVTGTTASSSITVTNHVEFQPTSLVGSLPHLKSNGWETAACASAGPGPVVKPTLSSPQPAWQSQPGRFMHCRWERPVHLHSAGIHCAYAVFSRGGCKVVPETKDFPARVSGTQTLVVKMPCVRQGLVISEKVRRLSAKFPAEPLLIVSKPLCGAHLVKIRPAVLHRPVHSLCRSRSRRAGEALIFFVRTR